MPGRGTRNEGREDHYYLLSAYLLVTCIKAAIFLLLLFAPWLDSHSVFALRLCIKPFRVPRTPCRVPRPSRLNTPTTQNTVTIIEDSCLTGCNTALGFFEINTS